MMLKDLVFKVYQETIIKANVPSDLKTALKSHERVPQFMSNLMDEISRVDALRLTKGQKPLKEKTITHLVKDMTMWFLEGIEQEATRRAESDLARIVREQEIQRQNDLQKTIDGTPTGEYKELAEEAGLTIGETKTTSI